MVSLISSIDFIEIRHFFQRIRHFFRKKASLKKFFNDVRYNTTFYNSVYPLSSDNSHIDCLDIQFINASDFCSSRTYIHSVNYNFDPYHFGNYLITVGDQTSFGKIKWRIWIPKVVFRIEMSYQKIQIIRHLTWDSVFEALYN